MEYAAKGRKTMKKKKILAVLLAGIVSSTVLAGCGSSSDGASEQALNLVGYDFKSLDPNKVSDSDSFTSLENIYECLTKEVLKDGKETTELAGAEKIEKSSDGLTYTIHLRKDAKWSDGKPVKASEYEYSWKRLTNPSTGADYMTLLDELNVKGVSEVMAAAEAKKSGAEVDKLVDQIGVQAKDDNTLVVTLAKPTPYFEKALSFRVLAPVREDKVKEQGDAFGADPAKMVYNGPFTVSEYAKGSKIVYKKNDTYWDAKNIKLEKATGHIITETTTLVKMFEGGELDITSAAKDDLSRLKEKAKNGEFQYITGTGAGAYFNYFNVTKGVLKNAKVRKAMTLALDRQQFLDVVYKRCIPSYGLVPDGVNCGSKIYRKEVPETLKTSVDEAKKLMTEGLKEEGITDPSKVSIDFLLGEQSSTTKGIGDYIQKTFEETFGIKIKQDFTADAQTYYKRRTEKDFDMCGGGWTADYNDVSSYYTIFTTGNGNNNGNYSNKEFDSLVKEASTETDENKRIELYKKAEDILINQDPAVMPTYYSDVNTFAKNYVKGFHIPKFGGNYDLSGVSIQGK